MSEADALTAYNRSRQWDEINFSAEQRMATNKWNQSVINSDHLVVQPSQLSNGLAQFIAQFDKPQFTTRSPNDSVLDISFSPAENESLLSEQLSNAILVLCYSLIVFVSLFGNTFVCRVMLSLSGNNRTTTNFLILNLAMSDLLMTGFNIPINIIRFVSSDWPFGSFICTATPFIQSLSAHCSSITMMVIAFERHSRLIGANPTLLFWCFIKRTMLRLCCLTSSFGSGQMTQTSLRSSVAHRANGHQSWPSIRIMVFIWLCSALLSIPHGLVNRVVHYPSGPLFRNMVRCAAVYPFFQPNFHLWLSIMTPISQYLLPIGLTALFYARIGNFLWRRTDPVGVVSEGRRQSILRRKRKRVKMLVIVVVVFSTCWFPLHLYVTLIDFGIIQHNFAIFFCVHWFACSSVVWNPFIYCWLNDQFRRKTNSMLIIFRPFKTCFERVLILFSCCRRQAPTSTTNTIVSNSNQLCVNDRTGSDESGLSNVKNIELTPITENGLRVHSNGSSRKCPELTVEMTTVLEMSEYEG